MPRVFAAVLGVLLQATFCSADAFCQTFQPARFPDDQTALTGKIKFPEFNQDLQVHVLCETNMYRSGEFGRSYCFSTHADGAAFVAAVTSGIGNPNLEPARVDGRTVAVWFQYTVHFQKNAGIETIELFPFHFSGNRNPGPGYTGPQRYHAPRLSGCRVPHRMWFSMTIPAEGGSPTDITLLNPEDGTFCEERTRAIVEGGLYIPAFLNGVPVSAPYRELWWRD